MLRDKYRPYKIIIDAGGLGKKIQEELNQRYSLTIEAAEKERKFEFISFMNSDLEQGYIKIPDNSPLAAEMRLLTKDEEKFKDGVLKEDERFDNHLCDAALYAWRFIYNYRFKEPPPKKTAEQELADKIHKERESAINRKPRRDEFGFEDRKPTTVMDRSGLANAPFKIY
jgi:hypothetical protein